MPRQVQSPVHLVLRDIINLSRNKLTVFVVETQNQHMALALQLPRNVLVCIAECHL